jgi:hypothetical protein
LLITPMAAALSSAMLCMPGTLLPAAPIRGLHNECCLAIIRNWKTLSWQFSIPSRPRSPFSPCSYKNNASQEGEIRNLPGTILDF